MKQILSIKDKQEVLIKELESLKGTGTALFGVEKEVAAPLVKSGVLHKDTWKYTGGCILNSKKHKA